MAKFVCFKCRKVFNRQPQVVGSPARYARITCAECAEELHHVGMAFRAPPQHNKDQWRKVELLVRHGFNFPNSVGGYPRTLCDARQFVKDKQLKIRGQGDSKDAAFADAQTKARRRLGSYLLGGLDYTQSANGWACHIIVTRTKWSGSPK